eukprot:1747707-Rhodomonas_salina.1
MWARTITRTRIHQSEHTHGGNIDGAHRHEEEEEEKERRRRAAHVGMVTLLPALQSETKCFSKLAQPACSYTASAATRTCLGHAMPCPLARDARIALRSRSVARTVVAGPHCFEIVDAFKR